MDFIIKNFKWVMLVTGALTATMFYGSFAPQMALESMFATSFGGELETLVARSWSAIIGLIGAVSIYGAFVERHRVFAAVIAAASKAVFVSLMLIYGQEYLAAAAPALTMDVAVIVLTLVFLVAIRARGVPTGSAR